MLRIAIGFLLGHCIVLSFTELPAVWPALGYVLATLFLLCLLRWSSLIACLLGGTLLRWAGAQGLAEDIDPRVEGEDVTIRGDVVSVPARVEGGVQFDFRLRPVADMHPHVARLAW